MFDCKIISLLVVGIAMLMLASAAKSSKVGFQERSSYHGNSRSRRRSGHDCYWCVFWS